MTWNNKSLYRLAIPAGKTKLVVRDPDTPHLYFEIRRRSRAFVFRMTRCGANVSRTLGQFPRLKLEDARKLVRQIEKEYAAKGMPSEAPQKKVLTLEAFHETYFVEYTLRQHKDSKANLAIFRNHIAPAFGKTRLNNVRSVDVLQWQNRLLASGMKPATVNRYSILLGQIIDLARTLDVGGAPERRDLKIKNLPVRNSHTVFLKPNEVQRLLEACSRSGNTDLHDLVTLWIHTGARKREALDMRWADVDLDNLLWTVPQSKNGRPRYIQLSDTSATLLRRRHKNNAVSEYVFPNPTTQVPYRCIFNVWKVAREDAGFPNLRIHDLRHSYASALVNDGVPIYDVQHLLGHASIKTTQRYAHLSRERLQASARCIDGIYAPQKISHSIPPDDTTR